MTWTDDVRSRKLTMWVNCWVESEFKIQHFQILHLPLQIKDRENDPYEITKAILTQPYLPINFLSFLGALEMDNKTHIEKMLRSGNSSKRSANFIWGPPHWLNLGALFVFGVLCIKCVSEFSIDYLCRFVFCVLSCFVWS